ncbi:MAG: phage tail tape measure protein, partial [Planctomycetota bacterium]
MLSAVTDGASSAADGLDRFSASARLAASLGAEVGKAVDLQTSILNAYRDANLSAGRAADVTFGIVRGGKVEIEDLAGSLDAVLPLAAQLGVSFEELGAVIVTATQKGGGFAQGMQAVRAILGTLTDASPETKKALEGVDFSAARIRAEGLVPVLEDISRKLRGNAESIRAVFPDGRAFGAVLALLADQGKGLAASLDELANSSGAVEDALGRRLQSPMVQLGIIVNRLRSELGERLGGAFTDAVSRAVATLGGLEEAARKIGDLGALIGAGFGAGLGVLSEVLADQTERLAIFIDTIGGADAIVKVIEQSARVTASAVGVALVVTQTFLEVSLGGLEKVRASWQALGATVRTTMQLVPGAEAVRDALDALIQSPAEAQERVAGLNRELAFLEDGLAKANAQKLTIAPSDSASLAFLGGQIQDFEKRITSVKGELDDLGTALNLVGRADALFGTDKFSKLQADLDGLLGVIDVRLAKPRKLGIELDVGDIEGKLKDAQGEVSFFGHALERLRGQAEAALGQGLSDAELRFALGELAERAVFARDKLNESSRAAESLGRELANALQVDLRAKQADLQRLRQGLDESRSAAQLLGRAGAALDQSFQVDAIAELEAEVAKLQARIDGLRG